MEDRLRDIIAKFGRLPIAIDTLASDDDLYEAGLSSLASVNLMLAVEDAFDIEFPDHLLTRRTFQSISSLSSVVSGLKSATVSS